MQTTKITHDRAVQQVRHAGEGWRQVAFIVGALSIIGGAALGYAMGLECGPGLFGGTECSAGDSSFLYLLAGAAAGIIPALPLAAISQLYGHLANLEQARTQT